MNNLFEWIFGILKKWIIVWMNILEFKKMNICYEWIFWIFIKWIMFWTNILVLVCLRQKWLSPNVSNSSEITHGSLVGPISVHFRGLLPILGPQEGSEAISWPLLGILNHFPHFFGMNNSIEYSGLYWMNIPDFVLNWILNWIFFRPNSMKKWIFKTYHPGLLQHQHYN